MRDDRRRGVAAARLDHHLDAVGREHFERGHQRRLGERVGVHAGEERPGRPLALAVLADGLADRQDVILVEAVAQRRAAVPRCAEGDGVRRLSRVGMIGVVGGDEPRDVDQQVARGGLAGKGMDGHNDLLKEARKAKVCSLDSASAGNVGFCRSVFMPVGDRLPTAFVEHFVYWGDSTPAYRLAPSGAMAGAIFSIFGSANAKTQP